MHVNNMDGGWVNKNYVDNMEGGLGQKFDLTKMSCFSVRPFCQGESLTCFLVRLFCQAKILAVQAFKSCVFGEGSSGWCGRERSGEQ